MGKRGPGKTPTATLKARGTFRKDRHSDDVDSQLESKVPAAPRHLSEEQRALWERVGEKLAAKGLLTDLDEMALELLVGSYTGMRSTLDELAGEDLVEITDSGSPVANPKVAIAAKYIATLKWCLREFGCTPSARTGIRIEGKKDAVIDPMAQLLGSIPGPTGK